MEKTKYYVYIQFRLAYTYVTTTRNCEDMINEIRKMHEPHIFSYFFIKRQNPDGTKVKVYSSTKNRKKWESYLYN